MIDIPRGGPACGVTPPGRTAGSDRRILAAIPASWKEAPDMLRAHRKSARKPATGGRFVIVASRYNAKHVDGMVRAAKAEFLAAKAEVERQLSINEDVLRWLTVRVEELDLELSPLLARRERERELQAVAPKELPFGVYLLFSVIVAIAAVRCCNTPANH